MLFGHYSNFYQNVPSLKEAEVSESRVRLCAAVACVLRQGLELLGIEAPERFDMKLSSRAAAIRLLPNG